MEEADSLKDLTSRFEAVKVAMNQDKNGHILKLAVHPSDTPEDIMRDLVGTRYLVVLVRLGEDDQPVPAKSAKDGANIVKMAGMLCADTRFQTWLHQNELAEDISEDAAVNAVRDHCGVKSRSELRLNLDGQRRFLALRDEFGDHLRRGLVR